LKVLVLSQYKTYVYPVMNTKEIKITEQVMYGGDDCESVPCGFVSNLVYEKKMNKKQSKNKRYRMNNKTKTLATNSRGLGDNSMNS
jgi:hypothetical protein